jgi:phosphoglucosamine mutase
VPSARLGRARRLDDAQGRYVEFCKNSFPNRLDLKGLRIVVDAANGAAYHTAPPVFHELGADVIEIGGHPDGLNINDDLGAVHPDRMRRAVLADRADYGIGLDGDADRLVIVDCDGRIFNGDQLLYAIISERLSRGAVAGAVGTLMSNLALEQALAVRGVPFARAKVGDRYVLEALRERGWLFGGESSGHILCLDCHSTGDGTISALQVLAAVQALGKPLAEICADLRLLPQELVNVRIERGFDWRSSEQLTEAVRAAETALGENGRVLIRPSGTEPLLRIMVEATDAKTARHWAEELARTVAAPAPAEED